MASTAHSFNKILNQPKYASKSKNSGDPAEDGAKKIRRLILVDGIPSNAVRVNCYETRNLKAYL
jgi:cell cycle arrest protein BUB2